MIYDNLLVNIGPGFVPGTYVAEAAILGESWQRVYIDVATDGSYVVSGNYWTGWAPNAAQWTWTFDLPPGPATIDPDMIVFLGPFCEGSATLQHAGVRVNIGNPTPTPTPTPVS